MYLHPTVDDEVTLKDVMKFIAGSEEYPPLGLPKRMTVKFKHGCPEGCCCRPTTYTYTISINLPVQINSKKLIPEMLVSSLTKCFCVWCLSCMKLLETLASVDFVVCCLLKIYRCHEMVETNICWLIEWNETYSYY